MAPREILSVGVDVPLQYTRSLVLRSAGFDVTTATSVARAVQLAGLRRWDAALLCHSLLPSQREVVIWTLREIHPSALILLLGPDRMATERQDHCHLVRCGPQELICDIRFYIELCEQRGGTRLAAQTDAAGAPARGPGACDFSPLPEVRVKRMSSGR